MEEEELFAALRLQAIPNVGARTGRKLIQRYGSAAAVFKEGLRDLRKQRGVGPRICAEIAAASHARKAEKELAYIKQYNLRYWYFLDGTYPRLLKHCADGPVLLFYDGTVQWDGGPVISIVGTRKMSAYGRDACRQLVAGLRHLNPVVVSGMAFGVDICAHLSALECGVQTVACLAHGLDRVYPAEHRQHYSRVLQQGAAVTEFWSRTRPERENFIKRNRIIAGIAEATVVIESGSKGGSLITADMAQGYHRDVFAIPGRISDERSSGCNALIRDQKAQLITSADELIRFMNWDAGENKPKSIQTALFHELEGEEALLWSQLEHGSKVLLDDLALKAGLPVSTTSATLLNLEMKGLVRSLPGKYFEQV